RRATSLIAAHSEPCSSLISATIRTARSRSSGGYLLDEPPDMTPTFPRDGVSGHAGAIHWAFAMQSGPLESRMPPRTRGVQRPQIHVGVAARRTVACRTLTIA